MSETFEVPSQYFESVQVRIDEQNRTAVFSVPLDLNSLGQTLNDALRRIGKAIATLQGINGTPKFFSSLDANGNVLKNLADPSNAQDAVNLRTIKSLLLKQEKSMSESEVAISAIQINSLPYKSVNFNSTTPAPGAGFLVMTFAVDSASPTGVIVKVAIPFAISSGGTNATTALAAFNNLSPLTTRGDLLTRDATNNVRLALGTLAQYLRSNGTDPLWSALLAADLSGTVAIVNGGTGQTTALAAFNALSPLTTRGDIVTRDATNNIRLALGTTGQYLRSNGTDDLWSALLAADLSGAVAIANGGTGQTTALAAFNALSPLTTRGDILTRDATNNVRLALGTAATYLRSNGTDDLWSALLMADASGTLAVGNGGTGVTTSTGTGSVVLGTSPTLSSPVINGTPSGTGIPTVTEKTGSGAGDYSTTSTTYVDVDATNLTYTVTVPTGWKLVIFADGNATSNTAVATVLVTLWETSLNAQIGGELEINPTVAGTSGAIPWSLHYSFAGDGGSRTFRLRYKTSVAADAAVLRNASARTTPVMTFILTPSN